MPERRDIMKLNNFVKKSLHHFASLALAVGVISTSTMCRFVLHQPEVPKKMKELLDDK